MPIYDNWRAFVDAIDMVSLTQYNAGKGEWFVGTSAIICVRLAGPNDPYQAGNDYYGWANARHPSPYGYDHTAWRGNSAVNQDWGFIINHYAGYADEINDICLSLQTTLSDRSAPVRCLRQL